MNETPWTSEALKARLSVTRALREQPPHSIARAMQHLELLDIIAAVDGRTLSPEEATAHLVHLREAVLMAA
jgi:hypothetical protein